MTISSWQECYDQNNARKITPDKAKARSLKDTAQESIKKTKELLEMLEKEIEKKLKEK